MPIRKASAPVEHLKRYTTLGMATDQGKTSNVTGLAIMAGTDGQKHPRDWNHNVPPALCTRCHRRVCRASPRRTFPPRCARPRRTNGRMSRVRVFTESGLWLRAQYFPKPGETHWRESVDREVLAVRRSVGVCDVTTLGKIDVQGRDAATFLNRIYCNGFAKLPVGKTPLRVDAARGRDRNG